MSMDRSAWIKFLRVEEEDDHARLILPSKPPVAGWSPGFLDEISSAVCQRDLRLLVDLSSIRFVNREIFEFLVLIIARAQQESWRLVFAGPNRVIGPHPLMQELAKHCVIARSLEDGRAALRDEEFTLWTPGGEAYDAPVDWNSLASMAGCLIVPLVVVGVLLLWFLR
jgi:anti-anti-sigma regulatory factor